MRAASPIALVALMLLPASAVGSRPAAGLRREVPAYTSSCDTTVAPAGSYPWPVAPFHRQHPVRGNFGDPRIIQRSAPLGADLAGDVAYQFHNGVDIVAPDGTPRDFLVTGGVPLNCTFAGTDLVITDFGDLKEVPPTAPMTGRLWRVPVGVEGMPKFRGAIG